MRNINRYYTMLETTDGYKITLDNADIKKLWHDVYGAARKIKKQNPDSLISFRIYDSLSYTFNIYPRITI